MRVRLNCEQDRKLWDTLSLFVCEQSDWFFVESEKKYTRGRKITPIICRHPVLCCVLCVVWQHCQPHWHDFLFAWLFLQVLRYFDYVFTGVFTFEMIIKVSDCQLACYMKIWLIILCKLTFDEQILWGLSDTGLLTHLPRAHWKLWSILHEFKSIPRLFVLPSTRLETECSFFNWNTGTWDPFNESIKWRMQWKERQTNNLCLALRWLTRAWSCTTAPTSETCGTSSTSLSWWEHWWPLPSRQSHDLFESSTYLYIS